MLLCGKLIIAPRLLISTFNIINLSNNEKSADIFSFSVTFKYTCYNAAMITYLIAIYFYKEKVIKSIENVIFANEKRENILYGPSSS